MRKNRKRVKRYSGLTVHTASFVALIVTAVATTMIYWFADSRCTQLAQSIGREERNLAAIEAECVRESARWDEMNAPRQVELALLRNGLEMDYPKPDQIVRMQADGTPYPGQLAVARAESRRTGRVASTTTGSSSPSVRTPSVTRRRTRRVR